MNLKPLGPNRTEVTIQREHETLRILYSYETPVACCNQGGFYKTSQKWSKTTSKHINQWFDGNPHVQERPQEFFDNLVK